MPMLAHHLAGDLFLEFLKTFAAIFFFIRRVVFTVT